MLLPPLWYAYGWVLAPQPVNGIATVSGNLGKRRTLSGAPAGTSTVDQIAPSGHGIGSLVGGFRPGTDLVALLGLAPAPVVEQLVATVAGQATVAGALSVRRPLAPLAILGEASVSGLFATLGAGEIQQLEGQGDGTSSVTAALGVRRPLTAQMFGTSSVTGTVKLERGMSATSTGVGTAAAQLRLTRPLSAAVFGTSTVNETEVLFVLLLGLATADGSSLVTSPDLQLRRYVGATTKTGPKDSTAPRFISRFSR